jgi:hypothetical protein
VKRGKEPLIAAFVPPKTRDLDPSSYFPNSFTKRILGNSGHKKSRSPEEPPALVLSCVALEPATQTECYTGLNKGESVVNISALQVNLKAIP